MRTRSLCKSVLLIALVALSTAGPAAAAPRTTAPRGFFGVVPQDLLGPADYTRMRGTVETIRLPVYWSQIEPSRGHYDFSTLDQVVGRAADAGIAVLPFVWGSPGWMSPDPARPPLKSAPERSAWAAMLRMLVLRYGPRGRFWRDRSAVLPIRRWQIWNEPNFKVFWAPRPSVEGYARLLGIAARAIRSQDRGARIILAGVAPIEGSPPPWVYLRELLDVPGVGRDFNVVALHPYAGTLDSLTFQIEQARLAMASAGDGVKPLQITEFGVASGDGKPGPMVKTPAGQATFLRRAYLLLLRNRRRWRISGADWFSWRDGASSDPYCNFCQGAGLFRKGGFPKLAWRAYKRVSRTHLLPPHLVR